MYIKGLYELKLSVQALKDKLKNLANLLYIQFHIVYNLNRKSIKENLHIMTLDKAFDLLSEIDIKDENIHEALEFIEDLAEGFYYVRKALGLGTDSYEKKIYIRRNDTQDNGWVKTWYDAKEDFYPIKTACEHCLKSDDEESKDRNNELFKEMNMNNIREHGYSLDKDVFDRPDEEDYKRNY